MKPININEIETGEEFFKRLQEINFAGCVGVKDVADAGKLLKALKLRGGSARP